MKEVKQYTALVDCYRNNGLAARPAKEWLYQQQTKGRYRVAAKSEKEAKKLVQRAIGFGSVSICHGQGAQEGPALPYRCVKKELPDGRLVGAVPATAPAARHREGGRHGQ